MTSVDTPLGATSHRRTEARASGWSETNTSSSRGMPSSSIRRHNGDEVNESARPSSARWSREKIQPLSRPAVCKPRIASSASSATPCVSPPSAVRVSVCVSILALGQPGSATQRPGSSSWQPRRERLRHPCPEAWLALDAVLVALEPAIPPTKRLLQKADCRARRRLLRIHMRPRADQPLPWHVEPLEQREDRISIPVTPTGDHIDRAANRPVVGASTDP